MALIQTVMRRVGHLDVDSHGLEISPEGEITLVNQRPEWRAGDGRQMPLGAHDRTPRPEMHRRPAHASQSPNPAWDTQTDLRALAARAGDQDDWDSLFAETEIHYGDVTDVDVPALPAIGDTTLPDLPALPDDLTEEVEPTLLDTPTLMAPYLTPVRPMTPVHRGNQPAERLPDPPAALPALSPWRARQTSAPRASRPTPGNSSKRLTRSEREALARVIALAKPRTSTTRTPLAARPMDMPTRTAGR
jgi:hypothetical protein